MKTITVKVECSDKAKSGTVGIYIDDKDLEQYIMIYDKVAKAQKNGIHNYTADEQDRAWQVNQFIRDKAYSMLGISLGYGPEGVFGHTETIHWKVLSIK